MSTKPFVLISCLGIILLSLMLAIVATPVAHGEEEYWSKDLSRATGFYAKNYGQAKKINIGPKNVDELRSGKYLKKVVKRIYDFRKGDMEACWVLGSLWGEKGHVTVKITTTRGTETNYEYMIHNRRTGLGAYGRTKDTMPYIDWAGHRRGKIDHLLVIKRKMAGSYWRNPSESVETKVTFTYHPQR